MTENLMGSHMSEINKVRKNLKSDAESHVDAHFHDGRDFVITDDLLNTQTGMGDVIQ